MTLNGATITLYTYGDALLEASGSGFDPSYCTGIKCADGITITSTDITITSTGLTGKGISSDADINIYSGNITITSTGNGSTYTNSEGVTDSYNSTCITADGNINIIGGAITTTSSGTAGKGISSDAALTIGDDSNSPTISITTQGSKIYVYGSGSDISYAEAKGISCDGAITINNGSITISSADDGIKSKTSVTFNNGTTSIIKSVEGIEAPYITVNDGYISVAASDDGFNATKGNGGETNDGSCLYLYGGTVNVNVTGGDGLDSNGNIVMTGGTVVVQGPPPSPEVGLDYNGTFNISGGLLIASGPNSGNMIQTVSSTSPQRAVKVTMSSLLTTSTLFHIQDSQGSSLVTFKPVRNVYYIVFSSSDLANGSTYSIYTGGHL